MQSTQVSPRNHSMSSPLQKAPVQVQQVTLFLPSVPLAILNPTKVLGYFLLYFRFYTPPSTPPPVVYISIPSLKAPRKRKKKASGYTTKYTPTMRCNSGITCCVFWSRHSKTTQVKKSVHLLFYTDAEESVSRVVWLLLLDFCVDYSLNGWMFLEYPRIQGPTNHIMSTMKRNEQMYWSWSKHFCGLLHYKKGQACFFKLCLNCD